MSHFTRRFDRYDSLALVFLLSVILPTATSRGEVALWTEPAIDTWSYVNGFGGGSRLLAPSFGGIFVDDTTDQFFENGQQGPARLGSLLMAFETDDLVGAGLEPSRYAVKSATVTVRLESGSIGVLPYTNEPVGSANLLSEALDGGITSQQPFELFGVGFRDGYESFDLGSTSSRKRFRESTAVYSAADNGYVAFPIVGDGQGEYSDVSNNLTGGFSETAPSNQTNPFEATPWAIGDAGLSEGASIPNDTTFTFTIDLTQPGVVDYLQESLSEGAIGFVISSLHPAAQPGSPGGGSYPQWYTKEAVGVFDNAEAPTLTLDYKILPILGDYDNDGFVDESDYVTWSTAYGSTVATVGSGADGNADGVINAADFTVWRDAASMAGNPPVQVPEPSGGAYALMGFATVSFCLGQFLYTSPREPKE